LGCQVTKALAPRENQLKYVKENETGGLPSTTLYFSLVDSCQVGIPDDIIEKGRNYKLITEVVQNGEEFTWTQVYPTNKTVSNKFVIGQECDMETIGGKKFKATVTMEGGKLSTSFPKYHHTSEISGGKLIEISTTGSVVLKRTSKKI
uniref:Fatty acid binding protein 6, ileal (gastrotropin) n=1 Tax=Esox lucius TaxID=8010 RepID=A0AAY5L8Y7_ESOLU